eukprot:CAMPEP_0206215444 /NCGR_PEP_ID=MMETSP0047_2-20121206/2197_1 /ASSEMBLY_ACC=CAM_ASM_000192 /TAXON_ID=195065 /ORGANISM="Chroomonas mesostigmatica_cf, Strain CCMP1168" /LENGTH=223 /DNA_ID=CAMNT_0053637737 /DNA_START=282 /DNA_END=950 /DNA_ORIENTATION=+
MFDLNCVFLPRRNTHLKAHTFVNLAGGRAHSLFVEVGGCVYACGDNADGQLGIGATDAELVFEEWTLLRVPSVVGEPLRLKGSKQATVKIVQAAAGSSHSLFLSQEGRVYACGAAGNGQLGLSTDAKIPSEDVDVPTVIGALKMLRVTRVAAGNTHSLFLTSNGAVWSSGKSDFGGLGQGGGTVRLHAPRPIRGLTDPHTKMGLEIREVEASGETSFFVSSKG